ncbi:MAG TPA: hypothetical protein VFM45_06910, partial [Anaeromyxobacteraceae bacterium]|nr:hypothetical protein [Anaeromyxobacteraceae bacterium]
ALLSLDLSPAQVVGGDASTGTVTLTSRALPGGAVVVLSSSDSVVSVPASVTVPEGSFTAAFPVATTVVLAAESATVRASLGAAVRDAVLALRPDPCAFVTDGAQWLGFSSNRNGSYDLFAIREDGTCLRPLTEGAGDDLFVTWSRVGVFAFMSARSGRMQVWVQGMGGGAASILPTGDLAATSPAFSPDGALVAFEGYAPGVSGSSDIYVVARAGGTPVKLTDGAGYNAGPAWSPDGATIYFVSNRAGRYDVWKVPATGGAISAVTTSSGILGRPAVTPDGRSLGYCRAAAGEAFSEVVLRDLGTGTIRVVSSQKDCEPAFDRTGQHVAVTSQRSGNPEVLLLDVATGAVVRALTSGTGIDGLAAFAPFP